MKLSEILFSSTKELWNASAGKPFVVEMAKGTLEDRLFQNYTIQDYLYLLDYVEILKTIREKAEREELVSFLDGIIAQTLQEAERVHLPNIRKYGVSDEEIKKCPIIPVLSDYLCYMRKCIEDDGLQGGLTALLQCSWLYAYIGENAMMKYAEDIARSKYRSWFEAYTCQAYLTANQTWINFLDAFSSEAEAQAIERLCKIFQKCAMFENELWDALYEQKAE